MYQAGWKLNLKASWTFLNRAEPSIQLVDFGLDPILAHPKRSLAQGLSLKGPCQRGGTQVADVWS